MENIPVIPYMSHEFVTALLEIFAANPVKNNRPSMKERRKMAKTYYDHDADLSLIQQKNVASSAMAHRGTRTLST
jgi:hypothetical protein